MTKQKIRYAVVGLGWIAQDAVLPAFANAEANSELTALVSDSPEKLAKLSKLYGVEHTYSYDEYDDCLQSGEIDAVFIALPNNMHKDFTIRALKAGIHVICEKPMSVTVAEGRAMVEAARKYDKQLMIAYRLHFEETNLKAAEIVNSGKIGEPRFFTALNMQDVEEGNIRLERELGGGPVDDLGIYCINAARYLFRAEPTEVSAYAASMPDARFKEVPEMVTAILHFPDDRLAHFTCSFGSAKASTLQVIGTKGDLKLDPAFSFDAELKHSLTIGDKDPKETVFEKRDQFAPQLIHFSDCILKNRPCEPSGEEGLVDMLIIEAIHKSIETGKTVKLDLPQREYRPTMKQEMHCPPPQKPELVAAETPGGQK